MLGCIFYGRLANTVPRFPTGGVGAKPMLGSVTTVQCQVTLGCVRLGWVRVGCIKLG